MRVNMTMQVTCTRPDLMEPQAKSISEARARLKIYLEQRRNRREVLSSVLESNGVDLDFTREGVVDITRFYLAGVPTGDGATDLPDVWIEFIWNFGQFVGDLCIELSPKGTLKWVVEDVAVPGTKPRFVFRVSGYAGKSESFDPDRLLLDIGRMKMAGKEVPDLIVVAHINRILRLSQLA